MNNQLAKRLIISSRRGMMLDYKELNFNIRFKGWQCGDIVHVVKVHASCKARAANLRLKRELIV
jgi:hypothetical protein